MLPVIFEKELSHLEHIVPRASGTPLPFKYWHARIDSLRMSASAVPFTARIDRLKRVLTALETEHLR